MSANSCLFVRPLLIAAAAAAGCFITVPGFSADDVRYFDKAPSADELRKSLLESTPQAKPRTRGIVFGAPAAPTAAPAPPAAAAPAPAMAAPAPVSIQAPSQAAVAMPAPAAVPVSVAPAAPAPVASAPAPRQEIQVSEKAIAFPINFRLGQSQIEAASYPFIDTMADFMKQNPNMRILVEGHTDASGNSDRNMALSRERAFSVSSYLIEKHRIDPSRLMAIGRGQQEPLQSVDPKDGRNRRVQFRVIGG